MWDKKLKSLKENTGSNLFDIGHRNIFLDMSPEAKEINSKLNYWDYTKIKTLHSKGNHQQNEKATHQMRADICK